MEDISFELTQEMKRHAVIVASAAGHSDFEISNFLNVARSFVNKIRKECLASDRNVSSISKRKTHSSRSDIVRNINFVQKVQDVIHESPGTSMRNIAKRLSVSESTVRRTVHNDLKCKSYVMKRRHFVSAKSKEKRLIRSKCLLNKIKHPDHPNMLWFFSDEKLFTQDQKVNRRNDRWLCSSASEVPTVMHTKFPSSLMILGVVSNEGHVMPPYFFPQGLRINASVYIEALDTCVKPWIEKVAHGRSYVFQQDSAPCHTAIKTQKWLALNFHDHVTPNLWPPSSPDLNPLDYFVWGVVEKETNKHPHNTKDSLRASISSAMMNMNKNHLIAACKHFRSRLEAVIDTEGDFIE